MIILYYCSVPGKCPLPSKRPCTSFQVVNVAASIQTYGSYVPGISAHAGQNHDVCLSAHGHYGIFDPESDLISK